MFRQDFTCPALLESITAFYLYGAITLYGRPFHAVLLRFNAVVICPTTPTRNPLVWAIPLSLATTRGISLDFFSSRYLDVSVPWVCFP